MLYRARWTGILILVLSASALAQTQPRNILTGNCPPEKFNAMLVPREQWHPYPTAADRKAWDGLDEKVRKALVAEGEQQLAAPWPALPATLFLDYVRTGDRDRFQAASFGRRNKLRDLVLAECVENKGRFVDEIVNGIWLICEETYWGVPAHISVQKAGNTLPDVADPTVDLFAAETAGLLAWTNYLLQPKLDKVSALVSRRISLEVDRRILTVNLNSPGTGWLYSEENPNRIFNNWNPWITSNWLTAVLLLERDDARRQQAAYKCMKNLDAFLNGYPADGGCDEGPGYWGRAGASLFDCLELLDSATKGAIAVYKLPLVQEIGRYIVRAHIYDEYVLNFADAAGKAKLDGSLIYRYGYRIGDQPMMALGAWAAAKREDAAPGGPLLRVLPALFDNAGIGAAKGYQPLIRDAWLPQTQLMVARTRERTEQGLYLAAQGGHNAESHNHNDVGNFVVFADGKPVFIDLGAPTYTAQTFSSRRYEIWAMQSGYHNCPTINGVTQSPGRQFAARDLKYLADDGAAELSMDIAAAYPAKANLKRWNRVFRLDRGGRPSIQITDTYVLNKAVDSITLSLMTPCEPKELSPGKIALVGPEKEGSRAVLEFDAAKLTAVPEKIDVKDGRIHSTWGAVVYRILLKQANPALEGSYQITIGK